MKRLAPCSIGVGFVVLLGTAATGCVVPAARYEEARSAIRVEQEAHRRTQDQMGEISRKLDQVAFSLSEREKRVEELERALSESKLGAEQLESERRFATELVEQLRDELGRTGEHLRGFAEDKQKLAAALDAAEARARRLATCEEEAADNAALVRDLTLLLREPIATGEIELAAVEGRAVLRVPASQIAGEAVQPVGLSVLAAVAKVTQLHPDSRVRISEEGAVPEGSEGTPERLRRISDQLASQGLAAERVELVPSAAEGKSGEATVVVAVYVTKAAQSSPAGAEP